MAPLSMGMSVRCPVSSNASKSEGIGSGLPSPSHAPTSRSVPKLWPDAPGATYQLRDQAPRLPCITGFEANAVWKASDKEYWAVMGR